MALQGKITTKRSLAASGSSQKRIEAQKILLTSGQTLSALTDVDTSLRQDGSAILYHAASNTFKVLPTIENANLKVIGGSF
jgi:hypothetical protein|tara:strand:+ start:1009 stop:1251 length:243 start_codon:yes stop_codon:yes gene_type:complete